MRINAYLILALALSLLTACDSKQKSSTAEGTLVKPQIGEEFPMSIQKGGKFASLDQIRVEALGIIEHRKKTEPEALSMLTFGYWNPEFVYNSGQISPTDQYAGYWIKFEDDFTYSYGQYKKNFGKGKYHFRLDDKSLYMLDDNIEHEPKVWTVNHNGEVIALVGTHEYGVNNGMQMKMVALTEKPTM